MSFLRRYLGKRYYNRTGYVMVDETRIERIMPEEVHNILTRVVNHYVVEFEGNVADTLSSMRDELIVLNDIEPLFRYLHLILLRAYNQGVREGDKARKLLKQIFNYATTRDLRDYLEKLLSLGPKEVNVKFLKRVLLFKRVLRYCKVALYEAITDNPIAVKFTNQCGIVTYVLLPELTYELIVFHSKKTYRRHVKVYSSTPSMITVTV